MNSLLVRPALLALPLLALPLLALAQERVFEPVVLPALDGGRPDEADPGAERPVVNVLPDGTIVAAGERIYDPEDENAGEALHRHLARIAGAMGEDTPGGVPVASGRMLIRADVRAPWQTTQQLLEACGRPDVRIARFDFAVRDPGLGPRIDERGLPIPDAARAQVLPYELPTDAGPAVGPAEPVEQVEVIVRVRDAGRRLGPDAAPWSGAGPYTVAGRQLEWSVGPRRTIDFEQLEASLRTFRERHGLEGLVIDARPHTTSGDALAVLSAARRLGYAPISFAGATE